MVLDHVKHVNDTHGHGAEDRVPQSTMEACRNCVRPEDIIARVGGEEFAVILAGLAISERVKATKRMQKAIAARTIQTRGGPFSVTASFGFAVTSPGQCDFSKAPATADGALYAT